MVVPKELIALSEPFLISNRFSIKEIIIFEKIFNKIDKSLKGYIDSNDFTLYVQQEKLQDGGGGVAMHKPIMSSSLAQSIQTIDFEKLLVFNTTTTLSFYQFLSILSLSGISLDCRDVTEESLLPPPPTPLSTPIQTIASSFTTAVVSGSPLSSSPLTTFLPKTRRSIVIDPQLTRQSSLSSLESNPKQLQRSMSSIQPITTPLSSSPLQKSPPMSIPSSSSSNNNNNINNSPSSPSSSQSSPPESNIKTSSSPTSEQNNNNSDDNEIKRISRMGNHRGAIKRS
ncbi:hypothetical protein CYY_001005 [Polysphondylium violaceum]|uniref:EF-hand domain-containing protein n=1 Tax=Polysphondylium violaceum TaxID=133409 RepID=A0A8J4Q2K9_9MYCE|nr:hypothetical protein CYY_001005 [Polysphondylium violaceum]